MYHKWYNNSSIIVKNCDISLIESVVAIIDDRLENGVRLNNEYYFDMLLSETNSLIKEIGNKVKEKVEQLYALLMQLLDSYVLREGYYLSKYIDTIRDSDESNMKDIVLYTYEYPELKQLPHKLKKVYDVESIIAVKKPYSDVRRDLDDQLVKDVNYLLDTKMHVFDRDEMMKTFNQKIKGNQVIRKYSKDILDDAVDIFKNIKSIKKNLKAEKTEVLDTITDITMRLENINRQNMEKLKYTTELAKYHDIDSDIGATQNSYEIFLLANQYYTELSNIIEVLYTEKIKVYTEMYQSYKTFVQKCLVESGVALKIQRHIEKKMDLTMAMRTEHAKRRA